MRSLRLALVLLLVAAAVVGTARADLFAVLPGADAPNPPGRTSLSAALLQRPAVPAVRTPDQLQRLWRAAADTYGVPWSVLAAVNSIESNFGRNMGPSSAGAVGWMQFMPGTWAMWGVDADGDGSANPWNPEDAVYAAARYLAAAGATRDVARAVFAYNHAGWYVDQVLKLAQAYAAGGSELVFGIDRLASALEAARAELAAASIALDQTRGVRSVEARGAKARAAPAVRAARLASASRVAALQARVAAAQATLDRLRAAAADVSFSPAIDAALGGPVLGGGHAFPVGGGPSSVSVAAGHHDYPAADIAAPAGAPVFALGAGVVERAWRSPDPACGVGLLLRTTDGRGWVYCHLALLETAVAAGLRVAAGTPLGLVGATGDATGPHLHLQLERADSWPQREPWLVAFAGVAFRWRAAAPAASTAPVASTAPAHGAGDSIDVILVR